MTKSHLPPGSKNKHLDKNVWKYVEYKKDDPNAPFSIGQILHVYPQDTDANYVPCIPKPEAGNNITRIPYKSKLTFLGMVEFIGGSKLMHFLVGSEGDALFGEVLLGIGSLPHLCNIPKRPTRGLNSRPKAKHPPGSGRGGKKSPSRLAKMQAQRRTDGKRNKP